MKCRPVNGNASKVATAPRLDWIGPLNALVAITLAAAALLVDRKFGAV